MDLASLSSSVLDVATLPPEIWKHIFSFFQSKRDMKMLSLVNRTMKRLLYTKLWNSISLHDPESLEHVTQHPVRKLVLK